MTNKPWYRHGHLWLVLSGPIVVVIAGFATLWIAVHKPDPVIEADYYRRGMEINKTLKLHEKALLPAERGRNHAATPAEP